MTAPPPGRPQDEQPSALAARRAVLETLARERFDLLVVGGGIVGAGTLLDAASRGLRAALVELDDIASGTSSRSSRLIHGGLRYLEQLRFELVHESLVERARLERLAPHLVRIEPFLFPVYGWPVVHRWFYQSGMILYDLLGSAHGGARHRHLSVEQALAQTPVLRRRGLRGGLVYHDGVEDDARYALGVVRTALSLGALATTRVRVVGPLEEGGRIAGVRTRDELDGSELVIRADRVVDATGVWAARGGPFGGGSVRILPSRGSHVVVRRERIPSETGITIRVPGRVVFVIPWAGHWIVGTTDQAWDGPVERPAASPAEVDELLATVNRTLDVGLDRSDVVGTYAGLRPLVAPDRAGSTVKVSREHRVRVEPSGLVRVGGGKYTTYRIIARDAVDAALGPEARRRPSETGELALVGAMPRPDLGALAADLGRRHGLAPGLAGRLVDRHGAQATAVAELGASLDLLRPLGRGIDALEAEVAWAAREELALSIDDVLARRMRLVHVLPDRGASIAPRVAEILGREVGWDAGRRVREVEQYLAGAHREYDVPPGAARFAEGAPASATAGAATAGSSAAPVTADPFGEHG